MPADFLSRSNSTLVVNAIQLTARDLADQQGLDPEIQALKDFAIKDDTAYSFKRIA